MSNSESNVRTLLSYESKHAEYIAGSPQVTKNELKTFIDDAFADVPKHASIFEVGAGFGRDAVYLRDKGFFNIYPTDGAEAFVEKLRDRGFESMKFNILEDDFPRADVVFANAVFLHLNRDEFRQTMSNIRDAINEDGKLIFTVKKGVGEEWTDEKLSAPRYFCYWKDVYDVVSEVSRAGFSNVVVSEYNVGSVTWIGVVAS